MWYRRHDHELRLVQASLFALELGLSLRDTQFTGYMKKWKLNTLAVDCSALTFSFVASTVCQQGLTC